MLGQSHRVRERCIAREDRTVDGYEGLREFGKSAAEGVDMWGDILTGSAAEGLIRNVAGSSKAVFGTSLFNKDELAALKKVVKTEVDNGSSTLTYSDYGLEGGKNITFPDFTNPNTLVYHSRSAGPFIATKATWQMCLSVLVSIIASLN